MIYACIYLSRHFTHIPLYNIETKLHTNAVTEEKSGQHRKHPQCLRDARPGPLKNWVENLFLTVKQKDLCVDRPPMKSSSTSGVKQR